jgi:hypothetical protein
VGYRYSKLTTGAVIGGLIAATAGLLLAPLVTDAVDRRARRGRRASCSLALGTPVETPTADNCGLRLVESSTSRSTRR